MMRIVGMNRGGRQAVGPGRAGVAEVFGERPSAPRRRRPVLIVFAAVMLASLLPPRTISLPAPRPLLVAPATAMAPSAVYVWFPSLHAYPYNARPRGLKIVTSAWGPTSSRRRGRRLAARHRRFLILLVAGQRQAVAQLR